MSRQTLERECKRENNENRGVNLEHSMNISSFWTKSSGNFFITGDSGTRAQKMEDVRRKMLLGAVRYAPVFSQDTLVILHNDRVLENEMIRMAGNGQLNNRQLVVISDQYPNYHLFYNMDKEKIFNCFDEVGRMCGYHNMSAADAYMRAFMEIVQQVYPVSLPAMLQLLEKTDEEILYTARYFGVRERIRQDFNRASENGGRDSFELVLNRIRSALSKIAKTDCETNFNMLTATQRGQPRRILLIRADSNAPGIFNLYLKNELDEIRGRRVSVILDDISVREDDGLMNTIKDLAKNPNNQVGLCAGDIFNIARQDDLNGFNTHCIFKHANTSSLQTLLNSYGTYRYARVQEEETRPDGKLFVLIPGRTYVKVYEENHPKIMLQDMSFAVLKGHDAERPAIVDELG